MPEASPLRGAPSLPLRIGESGGEEEQGESPGEVDVVVPGLCPGLPTTRSGTAYGRSELGSDAPAAPTGTWAADKGRAAATVKLEPTAEQPGVSGCAMHAEPSEREGESGPEHTSALMPRSPPGHSKCPPLGARADAPPQRSLLMLPPFARALAKASLPAGAARLPAQRRWRSSADG
mmetsp:Transcript_31221/g.78074  ORF Transcript_31221/g.78074 Transcript_31221/m.78074 type:complete len:177 (-) Transcript_31221:3-533(-)